MSDSRPRSSAKRKRLLSSSRPRILPGASATFRTQLSSRHTRSLIRTHHIIQKQLHRAQTTGDALSVSSLGAKLASTGGLQAYQAASKAGQSAQRGGDSSNVLVEWLHQAGFRSTSKGSLNGSSSSEALSHNAQLEQSQNSGLKLLEVGALSLKNACVTSGLFEDVERIDLHSTTPGIMQQDFMARPVPKTAGQRELQGFDVVSLSLVVNYVPDAAGRGEMLARVSSFLRLSRLQGSQKVAVKRYEKNDQEVDYTDVEAKTVVRDWCPGLFLVLPAPCVTNSRYMNEERLEAMMQALGYSVMKRKMSAKLVYYYLHFEGNQDVAANPTFAKRQVRKGGTRNNFTIILQ